MCVACWAKKLLCEQWCTIFWRLSCLFESFVFAYATLKSPAAGVSETRSSVPLGHCAAQQLWPAGLLLNFFVAIFTSGSSKAQAYRARVFFLCCDPSDDRWQDFVPCHEILRAVKLLFFIEVLDVF